MADVKTKETDASVEAYLNQVDDENKREESFQILELMREVTGEEPKMWGDSMVGFGSYHYRYESGREGDMFLAGFAPRKRNFSLYIMAGFEEYDDLLQRLGKHKTGKSCLYVNKLADVDLQVLRELVRASVEHMRETHEA